MVAVQNPMRVWPKPIVHIYESESRGREGTVYRVLAWHGVYECDCPARVECKHIKQQREADLSDLGWLKEIGAMTTIQEQGLVPVKTPELGAALVTQDQLNSYVEIAKRAVKAVGMVPKGMTEEQAVAVVLAGHELGFPPFAALRQMFPVNGKIQMMTEGWEALVRDRDLTARFVYHYIGEDGADVELQRNGRTEIRVKYTDSERVRAHQGYKKKGAWTQSQNGQRYFKAELDSDGNPIWLEDPESPWSTHRADMFAWAAVKRCIKFGAADLTNLAPREVRYHVIDEGEIKQGEVSKAVFAGSVKMEDLDPTDDMPAAEWTEIPDDGVPPDDGAPPIDEAPQQEPASASPGVASEERPTSVSSTPAAASPNDGDPGVVDVTMDLATTRQTIEALLIEMKDTWGKDFAPLQAEMGQFNPDGKGIFNPKSVPESKAAEALAFLRTKRGEA